MKQGGATVFLPTCALALLLSGCATVQTATNFGGVTVDGASKPVATVVVENSGYYLFGEFPLITGVPSRPNARRCCLFTDTVTLQNNMAMLAGVTKKEGGRKLANVKTTEDWTGTFSFWILWRKTIFTSALITE